jgi:hypothetical protein
MRSSVRRLVLIGILAMLPSRAFAQEATFNGVITDSSGAVLPGVTVTAVLEVTGNTFVAVSDERGFYRIPVRLAPTGSGRSCPRLQRSSVRPSKSLRGRHRRSTCRCHRPRYRKQ